MIREACASLKTKMYGSVGYIWAESAIRVSATGDPRWGKQSKAKQSKAKQSKEKEQARNEIRKIIAAAATACNQGRALRRTASNRAQFTIPICRSPSCNRQSSEAIASAATTNKKKGQRAAGFVHDNHHHRNQNSNVSHPRPRTIPNLPSLRRAQHRRKQQGNHQQPINQSINQISLPCSAACAIYVRKALKSQTRKNCRLYVAPSCTAD